MLASHIARQTYTPSQQIASVEKDGEIVKIKWNDDHESRFHLVWLRDNCSCDECGDHSGGHRFFELNMLPDTFANEVSLVDSLLQIKWLEDGHLTTFDPAWLRAHCMREEERVKRRHQPITWDATIAGNVPEIDYARALEDES